MAFAEQFEEMIFGSSIVKRAFTMSMVIEVRCRKSFVGF